MQSKQILHGQFKVLICKKKKSKQVKDDFKSTHYWYTVQTMYDTQWCSQNFRQEINGSPGTMSKVDV